MTKIKDNKSAIHLFEEAALKHGQATQEVDYKTANKCYANIVEVINFLKEAGELEALLSSLTHHSSSVRCWAATYLLLVKEKEATQILEELAQGTDINSLDAETTLSEWRKGKLKL